jgi:transposase
MAAPLVSDQLWSLVEPLLPAARPRGGRPPLDIRAALTGILFVLKSGIPWEMLPQEMGCGCGMTCWRRLRDWQAAGVWQRLHAVLPGCARPASSTGAAPRWTAPRCRRKGGRKHRAKPDRSRQAGTKRHLVVDRRGTPLGLVLSPANRHDCTMLAAALDAVCLGMSNALRITRI